MDRKVIEELVQLNNWIRENIDANDKITIHTDITLSQTGKMEATSISIKTE